MSIKPIRTKPTLLQPYYNISNTFEIGLDEAGRGPLFGRVYVAAAILPKDDSFRHADIKDSKKFSSKTKLSVSTTFFLNNLPCALLIRQPFDHTVGIWPKYETQ